MLGYRCREGNDVVLGDLLDLFDSSNIEPAAGFDVGSGEILLKQMLSLVLLG